MIEGITLTFWQLKNKTFWNTEDQLRKLEEEFLLQKVYCPIKTLLLFSQFYKT